MKTSDFDYELPQEYIAQEPAPVRDECKMLVLNRKTGQISDRIFKDIREYLRPGDLLVANETRVLPARLLGAKRATGGACEILLLNERDGNFHSGGTDCPKSEKKEQTAFWSALVKPGKRLKPGSGAIVDITNDKGDVVLSGEIIDWANTKNAQRGERIVKLTTTRESIESALHEVGHTPLPPYIKDYTGDDAMYQTVYSQNENSAAAPTAGLHFTPELIDSLRNDGIDWACVELEVGLDTFRIVDEENAEDHAMHTELYTVPAHTIEAIEKCKANGGRVIAVGTTSVRSLESSAALAQAAGADKSLMPTYRASTSLYIMPGYTFKIVDGLITNFHVPRSTLMMLVSAFAGRENVMEAYEHAKSENYRFLSFGDSMLIL